MIVVNKNAETVTLEFDAVELVGISNSILTAVTFHGDELHTLTALNPVEAQRLLRELKPVIDRMHDARIEAGLPW